MPEAGQVEPGDEAAAALRRKQRSGYRASVKYLRGLDARKPESLTARELHLKKKHVYNVRRYERLTRADPTQSTNAQTPGPKQTAQPGETAPMEPPKPKAAPTSTTLPKRERTDGVSGGRQRLDDKAKTTDANCRYAEDILAGLGSNPELQVIIIDRNDPEGKISTNNWLILEKVIMQAQHDAMSRSENPFIAEFNGIKWYKGAKAVACANEATVSFLRDTIQGVRELWLGAKIDVVARSELPMRTTIKVWVPPPVLVNQLVLDMIKRQNLDCDTDDWTIIRGQARDDGNGTDLWLSIGLVSKSQLLKKRCQLKLGMGCLRAILCSNDAGLTDRC
ncbi:uncharacterized protein LOC135429200 [Drosophila montana]|uniref:uncharacterized protein LOC135429200 n=1 Tax=Drosophila montana TaxID=40370 RepID=UPI00313BAC57